MSSVGDLIRDALLEIRAIDPGEPLGSAEASDALRKLNQMLSSWANDELWIYTKDRQQFSLTGGKQSYTIGVSGDWNTSYPVRPGQIDMASVLIAGGTVEKSIDILNDEQWRDVTVKGTPSTFPLSVWANGNYPLNTLYFWPVPTDSSNSVVLYIWNQTTAFTDVNTPVSFPQGYEQTIVTNLAILLAPQYKADIHPATAQAAREGKALIKRMNWEPSYRSVESTLHGNHSRVGQRSRGYVID